MRNVNKSLSILLSFLLALGTMFSMASPAKAFGQTDSSTANDIATLGLVGASAASEDPNIATVAINAGYIEITSVGQGIAAITVTDAFSHTADIYVCVQPDGAINIFEIRKYAVFISTTDSSTANDFDTLSLVGTSATTSNPNVATAAINAGHIEITSVGQGSAFITVTDETSHTACIFFRVAPDGAINIEQIDKYVPFESKTDSSTANDFATLGLEGVSAESNDANIATAAINAGHIEITSVGEGWALITVTDETSHTADFYVWVTPDGTINIDQINKYVPFTSKTDSSTANDIDTLGLVGVSAVSDDASVATAAINAGHIEITSVGQGSAFITVTDETSHSAYIFFQVAPDGAINIEQIVKNVPFESKTDSSTANDFDTLGLEGLSAESNDANIATAAINAGHIEITSVGQGSAIITVTDETSHSAYIYFWVAPDGAINIDQIVKYVPFESKTDSSTANDFDTLGLEGVSAESNNASIATAAINSGYIEITSVNPGTTYIIVTDAASHTAFIDFRVAADGAISIIEISKYAVFISTTDSSTANDIATLGLEGVFAESDNASIATAAINSGYIEITSVGPGTASITVTDAASHTAYIMVEVAADGTITIDHINKYIFFPSETDRSTANDIATLGLVGVSAESDNASVATAAINAGHIDITSVGPGTASITVADAASHTAYICVSVTIYGAINIEQINKYVPFNSKTDSSTTNDFASLGLEGISAVSGNANIATAAINAGYIEITSVGPGTAFITVADAGSHTAYIYVSVTADGAINIEQIDKYVPFTSKTDNSTANDVATLGLVGASAASEDPNIATVAINAGYIEITSVGQGIAAITVTDETSHTADIYVCVQPDGAIFILEISKYAVFISTNNSSTANDIATLGLVGVAAASNDPNVAAATINAGKIAITSVGKGSAMITVTNEESHTAYIEIEVSSDGTISIQIITKYAEFISTTDSSTANSIATLGLVGVSANSNCLEVATAAIKAGKIVITSICSGTAMITVADAAAHRAKIWVDVSPDGTIYITQIAKYITFTSRTDSSTANDIVTLGLEGVSAQSDHTNVATAAINAGHIEITSVGQGTAIITVADAASHTADIDVSVAPDGAISIIEISKYAVFISTTDSSTANDIATLGLEGVFAESDNASIATAAINSGYIEITSVGPGTASITVTDAALHTAYIFVSIASDGAISLEQISKYVPFIPQTNSSTVNNIATLGLEGVSTVSSNDNIATAAINSGHIDITSAGPGTASVTVTDAAGHTADIDVSVAPDGAIIILNISKYYITFSSTTNSSTANDINSLGLVGATAKSSNNYVATVAINAGHIAITSVGPGTASITVADAASHTACIMVEVAADGTIALTQISKYIPFASKTDSSTANDIATLGLVGASAVSDHANIATAAINAGHIEITSVGPGTASITVADATSHTAYIMVEVAADGTIAIDQINKYIFFTSKTDSSTANDFASLGLEGLFAASDDARVATVAINAGKIEITSVCPGTATIDVVGVWPHTAYIYVSVEPDGTIIILSIDKYVITDSSTANDIATLGLVGISAVSDDANVATAVINAGKIEITSVGPGQAFITVTDAASHTADIYVYVALDGTIAIFDIFKYTVFTSRTDSSVANDITTLGLVGLSATSSDANVATVAINAGKIVITSVSEGTAKITVADEESHTAGIDINVTSDGAISIQCIGKYVFTATDHNIANIVKNNVLLIGSYAFDLSVPAITSGYNLTNFIAAMGTAYETVPGAKHIYFRYGNNWYDLIADESLATPIADINSINGNGTYQYWNMNN